MIDMQYAHECIENKKKHFHTNAAQASLTAGDWEKRGKETP